MKEIFLKFDMTTDEDEAFIKEFGGTLEEDVVAINQVSSAGILTLQRAEVREAVFALRKLLKPDHAIADVIHSDLEEHFRRLLFKIHSGSITVGFDDDDGYVYKQVHISSTDEARK
mgnify:FL=1